MADLKQECTARRLSTKGLKDDLVERLREWDTDTANAARLQATTEAAAAEAAAAEGAAPGATNNAALVGAQELFASMHRMEVRPAAAGAAAVPCVLPCVCFCALLCRAFLPPCPIAARTPTHLLPACLTLLPACPCLAPLCLPACRWASFVRSLLRAG